MKKLQSMALAIFCLTLVLLICGANAAFAQEVTATIAGTITDQSGEQLPGPMLQPSRWTAESLIPQNPMTRVFTAFRISRPATTSSV